MIKIVYRNLSPGLHASAEAEGRNTVISFLPGLTPEQRRAALRRIRHSGRMGHGPRSSGRAAGYCADTGPGARGRAHVHGCGPAASGGEHAPGGLLFGCGGHICLDGHRVYSRAADGTAVVQPGAGGRRDVARAREVRARGRPARRTIPDQPGGTPRGSTTPGRLAERQLSSRHIRDRITGGAVWYPRVRRRGDRSGQRPGHGDRLRSRDRGRARDTGSSSSPAVRAAPGPHGTGAVRVRDGSGSRRHRHGQPGFGQYRFGQYRFRRQFGHGRFRLRRLGVRRFRFRRFGVRLGRRFGFGAGSPGSGSGSGSSGSGGGTCVNVLGIVQACVGL